ncbi:MAG: hypothetical protein ABEJ86_02220 [Halococcoides sp.]
MALDWKGVVTVLYLGIVGFGTLVVGTGDVIIASGGATTLQIVGAIGTTAAGAGLTSVALALYFEQEWARIFGVVVLTVLVVLNGYTIVMAVGFDRWFAAGQVLPNLIVLGYLTLRNPLEREGPVDQSESATRIGTTLK